jgi:hypothetical protein
MGLEGNLMDLTTQPLYALQNTASMAGMGLAMEGQEGNEVSLSNPVVPIPCSRPSYCFFPLCTGITGRLYTTCYLTKRGETNRWIQYNT